MNKLALTYLNRLSDLLFILARYANREAGDVLWVPVVSETRRASIERRSELPHRPHTDSSTIQRPRPRRAR